MGSTVSDANSEGELREIDARLRAWRRTGNPTHLWPQVGEPERLKALSEIERVTRAVLTGAATAPRLCGSGEGEVRAVGVAAFTSGMGPLLGYWVEAGKLDASAELATLLARHLEHGRQRFRRLEAALTLVLDAFAAVGITPVVLKGFHTARAYFSDPGTRPLTDIDLLVSEADFRRAPGALRAAGLVESPHRSSANRCDWIPPDASRQVCSLELCHADNPWSIDLHASLDRTLFRGCTVGFGAVGSAETAPWGAIDRPARVLGQPLLTAFLALHTSQELHSVLLLRLVELVLVIRRDWAEGRLEWEALHALLARAGATRFVFPALTLVEKLVPGTLDAGLRDELAAAATPRMRRVLERMTPADAQRLDHMVVEEKLMWADGPGDVVRRAIQLVRPLGTDGSVGDLLRTYRRWLSRLRRGRISLRRGTEIG